MSPRSGVKLAPLLAQTHRTASTVNLKAGTASHRDGWVFAFAPADDDPTATDGRCVAAPDSSAVQASQVSRIAREAGDIFAEAMRTTGRRRGAGRPRSVGGRRIQLYLDDDSLQTAAQLGDGNISLGIRQALRLARATQDAE